MTSKGQGDLYGKNGSLSDLFLFRDHSSLQKTLIWLAIILGAAFRLYVWYMQPRVTLDDEIGHFIIARDAWRYPILLFSYWGRTGCTLFYMLPALSGWLAARALSFITATLVIFLTIDIGRKFSIKNLWLIPILLQVQPWYYNNTHEVLTEIPAMFVLAIGVCLFFRGRINTASIMMGLLPLIRTELIALTGLWVLLVLYKKHWKGILFSILPILSVDMLGYLFYGISILSAYSQPHGTDAYGKGTWAHFFLELQKDRLVGIPVLLLSIYGFSCLFRSWKTLYVACAYLSIFLINTIIYRFGLYSSGGFGIFLLTMAPMIAIAATLGLENIFYGRTEGGERNILEIWGRKVTAAIFLILSVTNAAICYAPMYGQSCNSTKWIVDFIKDRKLENHNFICSNPWFYYYLPLATPHENTPGFQWLWAHNRLESIKSGDMVVWEDSYSDRFGHSYEILNKQPDKWKKYHEIISDDKVACAIFIRK